MPEMLAVADSLSPDLRMAWGIWLASGLVLLRWYRRGRRRAHVPPAAQAPHP